MVDRETVFNELQQHDFIEMYEVSTFKGVRKTADGAYQEVTVEVWDAGPDSGGERYAVIVTVTNDPAQPVTTGNAQDNLADALRVVHWRKLDEPTQEWGVVEQT